MRGIFLIVFFSTFLLLSLNVRFCLSQQFWNVLPQRLQRVRAQGAFSCGAKSAANVTVTLADVGSGGDILLDRRVTSIDGTFSLDGSAVQSHTITPVLRIYHNCDNYVVCPRAWMLTIPPKYIITEESNSILGALTRTFNIGNLNLESHLRNEDRVCYY